MDAIQLKHNQINNEIMRRNVPSQPLQPYFSIPSVNTRYVVQPKYDFSTPPCLLLKNDKNDKNDELGLYNYQHSTYNTNTYFYPGNRKAPFSGFSSNINTESELRNQHVKLCKTDNNKYIPHSKSNLYNFTMTTSKLEGPSSELNPHFLLFQDYDKLCSHKHEPQQSLDTGLCIFNNHSRLNK
jgi:hypothetical protein